MRHANLGELDAALEDFQGAYRTEPDYSVLYNIGSLYSLTGRPVEAIRAWRQYLEQGGARVPDKRRGEVSSALAALRKRVGQLRVNVRFELRSNPSVDPDTRAAAAQAPTPALEVDGHVMESSWQGAPIDLASGSHALVVRAPGFQLAARSAIVTAERETTVDVSLRPELSSNPGEPPPTAKAVELNAVSVAAVSAFNARSNPPRAQPTASHHSAVPYALAGGGLVLGAVAVVLAIESDAAAGQWRTDRSALERALSRDDTADAARQATRMQDSALEVQRLDALAIGAALLSAASLTTAGILYFSASPRARSGTNVEVGCRMRF